MMATIEKTVCDVCGDARRVYEYATTIKGIDAHEVRTADLCTRHFNVLLRFIERAIRPRGKAQKANAPAQHVVEEDGD